VNGRTSIYFATCQSFFVSVTPAPPRNASYRFEEISMLPLDTAFGASYFIYCFPLLVTALTKLSTTNRGISQR
jgi:hypothetical protein